MRVRKLIVPTLIFVTLLVILLGLIAWWLSRSDPSWYRPIRFDEAAQAQQYKQLESQVVELRNQVGQSQVNVARTHARQWPAFEVMFTEDQINGTVSRWQSSPLLGNVLSKVSEPHLRFLEDRIEMAGRVGENGPLMSLALTVDQTSTGPKVQLGRPYAGRMPLTRSPLEDAGASAKRQLQSRNVPAPTVEFLMRLLAGEELAPIVVVPTSVVGGESMLPARVEKLTIKDGMLRATLRPFDPKTP